MESSSVFGVRLPLKQRYFLLLCIAAGAIITYHKFTRKYPVEIKRMSRVAGLTANTSQFTLEGKPFRILGGSIHYFRVPRAYWQDRLMKLKSCGLNTLTTYVPWNLHEPEQGVFNFEDQLDLEAFLHLASSLGLWVILRPGPYICAEWDLGGLPSWLLRDRNMKLRTTYQGFTDAVNAFFDQLIKKVVPHQFSKGGPIIAVQVENEYGSYAKDKEYMPFIKEALLSRGITELLMTSDNKEGLKLGGVKGALETINFQKLNLNDIKYLDEIQPQRPKMVMEYWSGWFDLWGNLHHVYTAEVHPLPELPPLRERRAYQPAVVQQHLSLWDILHFTDKPLKSEKPINMENLPVNNNNGQSYGYTLYETIITRGGLLNSKNNIRDRALVFVDKIFVGVLDYKTQELALPDGKVSHGRRTLGLLVENCGRVNYGQTLDEQRKGLVGDIELNKEVLRDFIIHSLDMKPGFLNRIENSGHWKSMREQQSFPTFFQAKLYVNGSPKDTFIKLPGWSKGVIFINGKNLGRYWSIGPQQTLYVPGPWLHRGDNQVLLFEEQETDGKVLFTTTPDYGMAVDV
ncbi:beta-galactosidase-1-like protein 2 isoform X3 [Paralichthys olivaceus]|uniref:beta-galactosidase-1-like protein 2 isoform X3 n=1 Tax=Paralichthys olivaceus TaxID=8255 RepID=UPI0037513BDA